MSRWSAPERGGLIARALAGSWREHPLPLPLSADELAAIAPVLLWTGAGALAWQRARLSELRETAAAARLHDQNRSLLLRAAQGEHSLRMAVTALHAAGITPVLAKGWAVARHYRAPGLRAYSDLDLFVGEQNEAVARRALAPLRLAIEVDLQSHPRELPDRPFADVLARAERVALGDTDVRVLAAEDHLRMVCLHQVRHGYARPLWLCDVGASLESLPPAFDWDRMLEGDRVAGAWVACILGLARVTLDARLPITGADADRVAPAPAPWVVDALFARWALGPRSSCHRGILSYLRAPRGFAGGLRERWPNPLVAAYMFGGVPTARPVRRYQFMATKRRATIFLGRLGKTATQRDGARA